MKQPKRRIILVLVVISLCETALSMGQGFIAGDTLAVVGSRVITMGSFGERYRTLLAKNGLTDNVETRMGVLNNLVRDEIFIAQAKKLKLDQSKETKKEHSRIQQQELLNAYTQKHIINTVDITENDLKEFYVRLQMQIKVRHLFAPTKNQADSLYAKLQNGSTFAELAKNVYSDPMLRDNGGSLGYIKVDEMDIEFEKAAFALKIGEISKPVKTVQGYSIIQVDDIQRNPFVTEYEYARSKERMHNFVQKRKYEEAAKLFTAKLQADLQIVVNTGLLSRLFELMKRTSWDIEIERSKNSSLRNDLSKIIVTTKKEQWSVRKLIGVLSGTSEAQRKWIHTEENFKEYVSGLIMRTEICDRAKKEKLDKSRSYQNTVEYKFDTYVSDLLVNSVKKNFLINDDSLKEYYRQNKSRYAHPPTIRLSSLLLSDKKFADSVLHMLQQGETFERVAKQFSIQTITAERGGDMGFFRKDELGRFGDEIFALHRGEWKGPFIEDGKYLFVKCTDIGGISYKSFNETKEEIKTMLVNQRWYAAQDQYVERYKKTMFCRTYPERIMAMNISMNNY